MAMPQCPDFQLSTGAGYGNLAAVRVIDGAGAFSKLPTSTVIHAQIANGAGSGLTTSSTAAIYLQVGPGPTYTDVVLLAQLNGAAPAGAYDLREFPLSTVLPFVNRPFNWQTDRFNWRGSVQDAGGSPDSAITFSICGALPPATANCCTETLAKLDQILAYVGKTYTNQP